jgi:hypothetical protein
MEAEGISDDLEDSLISRHLALSARRARVATIFESSTVIHVS